MAALQSTDAKLLPLAAIDVSNRLRPVDGAYVTFLALSLDEQGLNEPIVVRPGKAPDQYKLVAGAHRYAAAAQIGWEDIPAIVRLDLTGDDEARLVEISENLVRRELSALDRAIFLREWRETMFRLHPELRQGGDRKSAEFQWRDQTAKLAVWSDVADRVGLSDRAIRRSCAIAEKLDPKAIERIRGTDLAANQAKLEVLAKLPRKAQIKQVEQLLKGAKPAAATPSDDDILSRLTRLYRAAPKTVQRRFRAEVLKEAAEA